MTFWVTLAVVLGGFSALFLWWRLLLACGAYQGLHVCACPADGGPVLVRLRAWRAGRRIRRAHIS